MPNEEVQDHHGTVGFEVFSGQQVLHLKPRQSHYIVPLSYFHHILISFFVI